MSLSLYFFFFSNPYVAFASRLFAYVFSLFHFLVSKNVNDSDIYSDNMIIGNIADIFSSLIYCD